MVKKIAIALLLFRTASLMAQHKVDSVNVLEPVEIRAYFGSQPALTLPSTVSVITLGQPETQQPYSLVPAVNAVPGVRMEERSPGSYRLSIRGSLLRSPFGIRNVKIYMDDFLLTDAGGNSYLGSVDPAGIGNIEIVKGPEASVFGANTGGVVLIGTGAETGDTSLARVSITAGSFGLLYQKASLQERRENPGISIRQAWQRSDGYRENSSMERKYIQAVPTWNYSHTGTLKALILYSDMNYRTPGGLTEQQFNEDPREARPASGNSPGAAEQKAGIINKTVLGGAMHEYRFSERLRHVIAFSGSHTDFKNPFITNYEVRNENSLGIRTYIELKADKTSDLSWRGQFGFEAQRTTSNIANYGNRGGSRDTLQAADDLRANQKFLFFHVSSNISSRLIAEAAASVNFYNYVYANTGPVASAETGKAFKEQFMPRVALSYAFTDQIALRASVSRGYSPPTIAEVRASDNLINTSLQAETGWNCEAGLRASLFHSRLYWDAVVFNFNLEDAIVRRLNEEDNEYFVNAGGTRQTGVESQLLAWLIPPGTSGFLRSLRFSNSYTFSSFYFRTYINGEDDYSGNRLTGVPRHILVTSISFNFPSGFNLSGQHNYTSSMPLNDAGSKYAKSYHLLQVRVNWSEKRSRKHPLSAYIGVDNLLNQKYSLGNDLNAFGNRYFNPAPLRNFFAGINMDF